MCLCRSIAGLLFASPGGGGGGVLTKKLGRGVRPTSQNPYPIYDQNHQIFDTLFMTRPLNQYPVSDLPYNYFPSSDQC